MNALAAGVALAMLAATPARAVTYYVRADGGSFEQCDGTADAAHSGSGLHRACAWRHPFDALPPGGPARIAGGDTLIVGEGSYRMGLGAPDTETLSKCRREWPWDCHATAVPGGPSRDRPTRILGAGYDSGCRKPPEWWGAEHASAVLDLRRSSNVEIACLEITDHSGCIEFHNAGDRTDRCERENTPYGDWASVGIVAADSANVTLTDVDIHGLAHDGIRAARVRDWTLQRVRIVANGWSGWNGDLGDDEDSSDAGHLVFRDVEIAWNGCRETWPAREHSGCWGQKSGGYGDGLGTGTTGGDWLFERVHAHHNTQDGLDLLHAAPDATIVMRQVRADANAGNQLKASGSVTIEDSQIVGNCSALEADGLAAADSCRAMGNSVSLNLARGARVRIANDTIEGEGDCLVGLQCSGSGCRDASAQLSGNRLQGRARGGRAPCSLWVEPELRGAAIEFGRNEMHATRSSDCPAGAACREHGQSAASP